MILAFNPASRQVINPDAEAQYIVLSAATATGPAAMATVEIWLAG
jgi:hypothetical protein